MAKGALWKGNIHFGDTNIAVKLHTAVREDRIDFHLLHRKDRVRLLQQMVCAYEERPVPREDQAKGFEVEEGKFIIVDQDELEGAAPESSRMIEVHEFVRADEIDPKFLDRVYYLEPDVSSKGYAALFSALKEMAVAGISTWTMRKRAWFGAVEAGRDGLRLITLRHADEVVPASSLELGKLPVSGKELKIGIDLIIHLTAPFEPARFKDEHLVKLRELIERKARGEKIALLRPRRLRPTEPDRLLKALQESLKKVA